MLSWDDSRLVCATFVVRAGEFTNMCVSMYTDVCLSVYAPL